MTCNRFAALLESDIGAGLIPENMSGADLFHVTLETQLGLFTPSELCMLSKVNRFARKMLAALKENFEFVVKEIPPMLALHWTLHDIFMFEPALTMFTSAWRHTRHSIAFTDDMRRLLWCTLMFVDQGYYDVRIDVKLNFSDDWSSVSISTSDIFVYSIFTSMRPRRKPFKENWRVANVPIRELAGCVRDLIVL